MSSAIDRPPLVDISTIAAAPPIAPVKPSQHAQDRNASSHHDDTFGNLPVQLDNTLSPDETLRNGAISMLKRSETCHGFCCALLSVLRSPTAQLPRRLSAAAYLKNFVRKNWNIQSTSGPNTCSNGGIDGVLPETERATFRAELLGTLLAIDVSELRNMLAEVLRLVAAIDFPSRWPALLSTLGAQIKEYGTVWGAPGAPKENAGDASSKQRLLNAVVATHVLTRPFESFRDITVAHEAAPQELNELVTELLLPLQNNLLGALVADANADLCDGETEEDKEECYTMTRLLCKIFFRITKCFMPTTLEPHLERWVGDMVSIIEAHKGEVVADDDDDDDDDDDADDGLSARWKLHKRVLQTMLNLYDRHRCTFTPFVPRLVAIMLPSLQRTAAYAGFKPAPDRISALRFEFIGRLVTNGVHQKLILPHISSLMDKAIFPALIMSRSDVMMWFEDEEEYLSRNLEAESELHDEVFTARQAALDLISLLAAVKTPEMSGGSSGSTKGKGKGKGKGRPHKGKGGGNSATKPPFDVVLKFAEQKLAAHEVAGTACTDSTSCGPFSVAQSEHFGVLLVFAALAERYAATKSAVDVSKMLKRCVFPVCKPTDAKKAWPSVTPLVAANAQFVLTKFATEGAIPDTLKTDVLNMLLLSISTVDEPECDDDDDDLLADDNDDCDIDDDNEYGTLKPLRVTAAHAMRTLLEQQYNKEELVPMLGRLVGDMLKAAEAESEGDSGACNDLPLTILQQIISAVEEEILPHVRPIAERLVARLHEQIDEEVDISMSSALEVFGLLIDSLSTIEEVHSETDVADIDDAAEVTRHETIGSSIAETSKWMCGVVQPLLQKLWTDVKRGSCDDEDDDQESDDTPYLPETTEMLKFVVEHTDMHKMEESAQTWQLVHLFCTRLRVWATEMEVEDAEEAWTLLMSCMVQGGDAPVFTATPQGEGEQMSVQALVIDNALHVIEAGHAKTARFGCRLVKACLTMQRDGWPSDVLQRIVSTAANEMMCEPSPLLQQELVFLLCFCYFHSPELVAHAMTEAGSSIWEFARAFSELRVEDLRLRGATAKMIVASAMKMVKRLHADAASASMESRRHVAGVMEHAIVQLIDLEGLAAEDGLKIDEDEHANDAGDSEDDDSENDSEEEEEEEEDGDGDGDGDDEDEDGDMEDDEDGEEDEDEEETEEEMLERYAEIARQMEAGVESEDDDADEDEDFQIEDEVHDAFEDFAIVDRFITWFKNNRATAEDVAKRTTLAEFKKAFKGRLD